MSINYNDIQVRVLLDNLRHNWSMLNEMSGNAFGVIKSDAYGHGLGPCGRTLVRAGARTLAVGTVGEAVQLREELGKDTVVAVERATILALLGAHSDAEADTCAAHDIVPMVFSAEQAERLNRAAGRAGKKISIALKFDTGMSRLGFLWSEADKAAKVLGANPYLACDYASSHLATADEPAQAEYVMMQARRFEEAVVTLQRHGYDPQVNLANSGAILAYPELHYHAQRAGIAMYGANPFHGTELAHLGEGLKPTMEVSVPVLQVHDLAKGTPIHYGCSYVAPRDMRVAIVGLGYADAFSRSMSSGGPTGKGCLNVVGKRAPIVGRVCMQMSAIDVTDIEGVAEGDRAYVLGGEANPIHLQEMALWWDTITYEVLCLLGMNPRTYIGDDAE